ncbi:MAG: 2-amino-4-hydroxy-6-hydroxymethyldihydropteridine diphosphokinase, partial [Desulfarculaceae bacterium]|nr:2-amino-4-hydroxy-6-hydroxymethyldihydropteridine diphosphokinase [Desulfarculaceae bacterium]
METAGPVYISIGSNIGDRESNLTRAADALDQSESVTVTAVSPFYMTEPVDYTDQDWFVNAVLKVETGLLPRELLSLLKGIETKMGRHEKSVRFGPRVIDLDIVYYADQILKEEGLEIPHPRMHKRYFVLQPLCDIDRDVPHPVFQKTPDEFLREMNDKENQKIIPLREE